MTDPTNDSATAVFVFLQKWVGPRLVRMLRQDGEFYIEDNGVWSEPIHLMTHAKSRFHSAIVSHEDAA